MWKQVRVKKTHQIKNLEPRFDSIETERALGRRFQFGIEVGNDILECGDGLLNRRDLHQLPAADRAVAVLQGDDQIPSLLLKLNKR